MLYIYYTYIIYVIEAIWTVTFSFSFFIFLRECVYFVHAKYLHFPLAGVKIRAQNDGGQSWGFRYNPATNATDYRILNSILYFLFINRNISCTKFKVRYQPNSTRSTFRSITSIMNYEKCLPFETKNRCVLSLKRNKSRSSELDNLTHLQVDRHKIVWIHRWYR